MISIYLQLQLHKFLKIVIECSTNFVNFMELELCQTHLKRDSNEVAYKLAQLAKRNAHSAVWKNQVLICIKDLVDLECKLPFDE